MTICATVIMNNLIAASVLQVEEFIALALPIQAESESCYYAAKDNGQGETFGVTDFYKHETR